MDEVERNMRMVRRVEEAFNARDCEALSDLIAEGFGGHNPGSNDVTIDGPEANNEDWHAALPGKRTEIIRTFGEGDKVVAVIRDRGTNTGGLPWFDIPANGRAMNTTWLQITRHDRADRIAEMSALADVPGLLTQLGRIVVPKNTSDDSGRGEGHRATIRRRGLEPTRSASRGHEVADRPCGRQLGRSSFRAAAKRRRAVPLVARRER